MDYMVVRCTEGTLFTRGLCIELILFICALIAQWLHGQGRSLFSLKTLKIPDLFSFFSFFFSPVFEIFPRRPDANFQVFGKSWGLWFVRERSERKN